MPRDLGAAVSTHKALVEWVRAWFPDEDEANLADTIEGLSMVDDAIAAVVRAALEREAMAKALGELIDGMASRKSRLLAGAQSMRAAALNAMLECDIKKLQLPDMTVSASRSGLPKVIITEAERIPEHLCRVRSKPNKTAIGEALGAGQIVPGATLGNREPSLSVRTK